jgi:hypothetical protein
VIVDEPAMWNLIPAAKRDRVLIAAKAMCASRDTDDDDWHDGGGRDPCRCEAAGEGTCVAFGLYGQMAIDVIEALDRAKPIPLPAPPKASSEDSR